MTLLLCVLYYCQVVCRQLGYASATRASTRAEFGEGRGEIWLDNVRCMGEEDTLDQCPNNGWADHNCQHSEDAGAVCEGHLPKLEGKMHTTFAFQNNRCSIHNYFIIPFFTKIN